MGVKDMTPRVGDKVVVPGADVGEVVAVETLDVGGQTARFCRILCQKGTRMWFPVGRLLDQGIRKVMSRKKALEVLDVAGDQDAPKRRANWNRRRRRYEQTMLGNQPTALAALLGELAAVKHDKGSLSFGEKKVFEQLHGLLVSELALALGLEPAAAEQKLAVALAP